MSVMAGRLTPTEQSSVQPSPLSADINIFVIFIMPVICVVYYQQAYYWTFCVRKAKQKKTTP